MPSQLELEYYPKIPSSVIQKIIARINENKSHWGKPFFMDVYSHVDISEIKKVCDPILKHSPKNLIVLGTGGSIQTMLALEGLCTCNFIPVVSSRPRELRRILQTCVPSESIVIPISRGGETLDVNSTVDVFSSFPMIGVSSQGPMYEYLYKKSVPILPVPDLAGRFVASISNVALVPAYLAGINIEEFLRQLDSNYSIYKNLSYSEQNIALQYASYLFLHYNQGYRNCFLMPYSSYLEGAAGLFVQEISESSGKQDKGMMGTKQDAPLCQHSVLEFLLGGSKGHTLPFLWTTRSEPHDIRIQNSEFGLINQSALQIINYQADATFQALLTHQVSSALLTLLDFTISSIAQLIAFIQTTIYYFCLLVDVNWENNPSVKTGKKICNSAIQSSLTIEQRKAQRENTASMHFSRNKLNF